MINSDLLKEFVNSLLITNRDFEFFVDWNNIKQSTDINIELNALNSLIKCKDFKETFFKILTLFPLVITVFPLLIALSKIDREKLIKGKSSLDVINHINGACEEFKFDIETAKKGLSQEEKEQYYNFFINVGLKNLFDNIIEKSVNDYVMGVLVGLDSNGRKNRSGKAFEKMCKDVIAPICNENNIKLLTQKKFKELEKYGFTINDDISNRISDFLLVKGNIALNIEANYYFSSGSKPEEIVDSYITRSHDLKNNDIEFTLITDGNCWSNTDKSQLNKAFKYISIMNYTMAKDGYLLDRIKSVFNLH